MIALEVIVLRVFLHRVVCQNSADRLSGPPFIVVEDPTQPFMARNGRIHIDDDLLILDQPIVEPLMISLKVIMLSVFLHRLAQMPLSQWNDLGQTLGLDGANESLRIGIQIGASCGKLHDLDARGFQYLTKRSREQRITIVDEMASSIQESRFTISEVSRDLAHPLAIRPRKDSRDLDSSSLEVDHEENEIPN